MTPGQGQDQSRPRVSVVIPTHDRAEMLREAVDSVMQQTFRDWELIIVDDCSSDATPEFCGTLDDPRITSVRLPTNAERSAARNVGLRKSRAGFVMFLDDDDRLEVSALGDLVDALVAHPLAVAAVGARIMVRPDGSQRRASHPRVRRTRDVFVDLFFDWVGLPSQCLFRRDVIVGAGGWNEAMSRAEDRELWLRIARLGSVVFIPGPVVRWRMRPPPSPQTESAAARRIRLLEGRATTVEGTLVSDRDRDLLVASERWVAGMNAYEGGDYRAARGAFAEASRLAPRALTSPLVGRPLRRMNLMASMAAAVGDTNANKIHERFRTRAGETSR